jgi:hypothetical protein
MITWPLNILTPNAVSFIPNFRNTGGSPSLSGASQMIGSAAGLWEASLVSVGLRNAAHVVLWESIEINLEGRLNPILVPIMEGKRQPFGAAGPYGSIPHSDDAFFSDGTGYYQPAIVATLGADLARGATTAVIKVTYGRALQPRDYFSIGDRLYRIKSVEEVDGTLQTVKFWPRAREAALNGAIVEFDHPHCKMRLKTDTEMAVDKDLSKFASPTIQFVEDLS